MRRLPFFFSPYYINITIGYVLKRNNRSAAVPKSSVLTDTRLRAEMGALASGFEWRRSNISSKQVGVKEPYESCTGSFESRRGRGGRLDSCQANDSLFCRAKRSPFGFMACVDVC